MVVISERAGHIWMAVQCLGLLNVSDLGACVAKSLMRLAQQTLNFGRVMLLSSWMLLYRFCICWYFWVLDHGAHFVYILLPMIQPSWHQAFNSYHPVVMIRQNRAAFILIILILRWFYQISILIILIVILCVILRLDLIAIHLKVLLEFFYRHQILYGLPRKKLAQDFVANLLDVEADGVSLAAGAQLGLDGVVAGWQWEALADSV